MLTQKKFKDCEDNLLACYAMKSYNTRGRMHKEKEHLYRSSYQRDRDRIVHSAAFRRLEYKTQVFVNIEGDYYRTRLTHTIEVAQIARTIAYSLRLNMDLTEAIALAHDLGHTPFGHAGEEILDELMRREGGFNHNIHGLRVVDFLEERYPDFPGLNLSWEVREGIAKHSSCFDKAGAIKDLAINESPTLEAQVVDIADEIAYDNHDIDDGITSGLLKDSDLEGVAIWDNLCSKISKEHPNIKSDLRKHLLVRSLIDMEVTDLINYTQKRLADLKIKSSMEAKKLKEKVVSLSPQMLSLRKPLRALLMLKLYKHYRVARMSIKAKRFIRELFNFYLAYPQALPSALQAKIKAQGEKRVICDYIAGMTDRYALDEYKKLFDPYEKV
ncbi:MAG: deoxyguanosinetriphosphate triphosphohydrolase [Candidatus Omnitrophica bacterium]|jgi:dGTPase|nr:deoxyguanosinetriphosphate triphosphohydrolase [Candidatus Omnitrophota bacterium]